MSATIPIVLTPVPVPVEVKAININQLLTVISQYLQASISADVSFFQTVSADPTAQTTPIIFNSSQRVFKAWDTGSGKYLEVSTAQPGDIKNSFAGGDSPQTGWVECDGRAISDVPGISQTQQGVLVALFGSGGSLPDLKPVQAISGLPAANAFTAVSVADVVPPENQIGNLPFSGDYNPIEEQNLAANTETLRGSQNALRTSLKEMQALSNQMLAAFVNPAQRMYAHVFVGYP